MNNKRQVDGRPRSPLILTVPAYGFVTALYLDWLQPIESNSDLDTAAHDSVRQGSARRVARHDR